MKVSIISPWLAGGFLALLYFVITLGADFLKTGGNAQFGYITAIFNFPSAISLWYLPLPKSAAQLFIIAGGDFILGALGTLCIQMLMKMTHLSSWVAGVCMGIVYFVITVIPVVMTTGWMQNFVGLLGSFSSPALMIEAVMPSIQNILHASDSVGFIFYILTDVIFGAMFGWILWIINPSFETDVQ